MKTRKEKGGGSLLRTVAGKAFDLLAALSLFFGEVRETLADGLDHFLRRTAYLLILDLWVSVGLLLMVLGVFDLAIDYGQVPRGVVYSIGGLVVLLVASLLLMSTRIKRYKK